MSYLGLIVFLAVFLGIAALVITAVARQRKRWRVRPAVLRSLATRRGYRFVEKPGKPSELTPIRPLDKAPDLSTLELPAAVVGRTLDADFTLFDVYTRLIRHGSNSSYQDSFATFITVKSDGKPWPHFEFTAMPGSDPNSLTGKLMTMAVNLADRLMKDRGLVHIPIPEQPGLMLFADTPENGARIRDALVPMFNKRDGWWLGGMGDALTMQRRGSGSGTMGMLIPENDLDRFIDESLEIERTASAAIRP